MANSNFSTSGMTADNSSATQLWEAAEHLREQVRGDWDGPTAQEWERLRSEARIAQSEEEERQRQSEEERWEEREAEREEWEEHQNQLEMIARIEDAAVRDINDIAEANRHF